MGYELHWIGEEILDYYISGAIVRDFDIVDNNRQLSDMFAKDKDIVALFESEDNMLFLTGFKEYLPSLEESEELFYLLDEDLRELINTASEEKLSLYIGIIALQYFQFDTLKEIMNLSKEELEGSSEEEKEEIEDLQKVFKSMDPKERELFLEQELFCYTESELQQWFESREEEKG